MYNSSTILLEEIEGAFTEHLNDCFKKKMHVLWEWVE